MIHEAIYEKNPFLLWLYRHGWEPPVGPLGPHASNPMPGVSSNPIPEPWRIAADLVRAAQAKDLASRLPPAQAKAVMKSANAALAMVLDDDCGTPPRKWPWPWPGPPPWNWEVVSALSLFANTLQPGGLQDEIKGIAGKLAAGGAAGPG